MPKLKSKSRPKRRSKRRSCLTAAVTVAGLTATAGAIAFYPASASASTQPLSSDNPFETDIPSAINSSGSVNGIDVGEPNIGDIIPNFPGLPNGGFPETPSDIAGTVGDILNSDISGVIGDVIPGSGGGSIPKIFKDILSGNMGGILDSILGVLTSQNEIFGEISQVVLGDGWEGVDGDGNKETPPDPYKVRLPQEKDEETGLLTRSPIVLRRDKANQYDQELGRAMAAPMLAEKGEEWLNANIQTSSDMMQAGLGSTQSAINKSLEATEATSTQEIVRRSAEISGVAATLQMQEMQQNAMLGESLWNMQRLSSAQLQMAANTSEAADEQNRRDRASRTVALSSAAAESMIIPGLADISTSTPTLSTAPKAASLFAKP